MAEQNPPSGEKPDINNLVKQYVSLILEFVNLAKSLDSLGIGKKEVEFEFYRLVMAEMRDRKLPEEFIDNMLRGAYWGSKHAEEAINAMLNSPNILLAPDG